MADVDALIDDLLSDPRLKTIRAFTERVFEDEPIIKRASQMTSYLPERYRAMRAVGRPSPEAGWQRRFSETERFVAQARFMADWEDDAPYHGQFNRYYPTYAMMNDQQLRGYFSWRTKIRRGEMEQAPLSFAFVHVYELLNCVGGVDAQACFDELKAFWLAYRSLAPELNRYMRVWLRDFVVWHNLPAQLLADVVDLSFEEALIVLRQEEAAVREEGDGVASGSVFDEGAAAVGAVSSGATSESRIAVASGASGSRVAAASGAGAAPQGISVIGEPRTSSEDADVRLYDALSRLSAYRIDRSAFAREHAAEVREVSCVVFRALCRHCAKRRKRTLVDSWFGMPYATPHLMFESAVVYMPKPHADCLYRVNAAHAYACRDGRWTALRQYRKTGRNAELGAVMQAIDRMMRVAWGDDRALQDREVPKYVSKAIATAIDECREGMRRREARTLVIDRSQLSGIRSRAADIREELLIDEERAEDELRGTVPCSSWGKSSEGCGEALGPDGAEAEPELSSVGVSRACKGAVPSVDVSPIAMPHEGRAPLLVDRGERGAVLEGAPVEAGALSPEQAAYVRALLDGVDAATALKAAGCTEDMMVDAVNEALFDVLGDTALEYGADGPQLIEDYRQDVEGIVRS